MIFDNVNVWCNSSISGPNIHSFTLFFSQKFLIFYKSNKKYPPQQRVFIKNIIFTWPVLDRRTFLLSYRKNALKNSNLPSFYYSRDIAKRSWRKITFPLLLKGYHKSLSLYPSLFGNSQQSYYPHSLAPLTNNIIF